MISLLIVTMILAICRTAWSAVPSAMVLVAVGVNGDTLAVPVYTVAK